MDELAERLENIRLQKAKTEVIIKLIKRKQEQVYLFST
jgi:hypothetical protein